MRSARRGEGDVCVSAVARRGGGGAEMSRDTQSPHHWHDHHAPPGERPGSRGDEAVEYIVGDETRGDLFVLCQRQAGSRDVDPAVLQEGHALQGPEMGGGATGSFPLSHGTSPDLSRAPTQMRETEDGGWSWCEFSEIPEGWEPVVGLELRGKRKGKRKGKDGQEEGKGKGVEYDEDGRPVGARQVDSMRVRVCVRARRC